MDIIQNKNTNNNPGFIYPSFKKENFEIIKIIYEGIDPDLLIGDFSQLTSTLTCMICINLVNQPICCSKCSKMFCKKCIDAYIKFNKNCPLRCENFFPKEIDLYFKNIINSIKVKCPLHTKGCKITLFPKEFNHHLENCKYLSIKCNICSEMDINKNCIIHYENCKELIIVCNLCKLEIKRKDEEKHKTLCKNRVIKCLICGSSYKLMEFNHTDAVCLKNLKSVYDNEKFLNENNINSLNNDICELVNFIKLNNINYANDVKICNIMNVYGKNKDFYKVNNSGNNNIKMNFGNNNNLDNNIYNVNNMKSKLRSNISNEKINVNIGNVINNFKDDKNIVQNLSIYSEKNYILFNLFKFI